MLLQFQPISWLNRLPREIPLCGKTLLYFTGWMLCSMKPNIVQTEHKAKLVWALLRRSQYSIKLNTCSTPVWFLIFLCFDFFVHQLKAYCGILFTHNIFLFFKVFVRATPFMYAVIHFIFADNFFLIISGISAVSIQILTIIFVG